MSSPVNVLDLPGIFSAVTTHAMRLGIFETVSGHETVSGPANGVHYEVYAAPIGPVRASSGLDVTSALVTIMGRVRINSAREPRDQVEIDLLTAVDRLISEYTGAFQLGLSEVRHVDVLGAYGTPLSARPGYIPVDGQLYRIADITIPIVCNDCWAQVP